MCAGGQRQTGGHSETVGRIGGTVAVGRTGGTVAVGRTGGTVAVGRIGGTVGTTVETADTMVGTMSVKFDCVAVGVAVATGTCVGFTPVGDGPPPDPPGAEPCDPDGAGVGASGSS